MESQCIGLAEALGLQPEIKRVRLRTPWHELTPYVRFGGRLQFTSKSSRLAPPWPDLLIATGRHSVAASLLVRRLSRHRTRTVQLQNPVIAPSHFDLVVVPRHDNLSGPNVVSTRGALTRVTPALVKESAADEHGDERPREMLEAPGNLGRAVADESRCHAVERAARRDDVRTRKIVVPRDDNEIEVRGWDDRILQLHGAGLPSRQTSHEQRRRDALASRGNEERGPRRYKA